MQKVNLVTVVGHNITMLPHMLEHYKNIVDEIYVVVYRQHENDGILDEIKSLGITPHKVVTEEKFNWERVTQLYNEVKRTKPQEWWVVSDDDEFHVYPKPIREMISECEENGWEFITGGFLDRIGENGEFPLVTNETDIWSKFPLVGYFRYPMSGACPNKVCVMKGSVDVTPGQHYATFNGIDTWRDRGWSHPKRYPFTKGLIQVHHFKWDDTCMDRIKRVADTKKDYSYSEEYQIMYDAIVNSGWKIDIKNTSYKVEKLKDFSYIRYNDYKKWSLIKNKIVSI